MCELVNDLIIKIDEVACNNNNKRKEHSRKEIGKYAEDFLTDIIGIKKTNLKKNK